eukprot:COSAG04_NODE_404_length_14877_cov_7.858371_1_plen_112_part_10
MAGLADAVLCLAVSSDPTSPDGWRHRGVVFNQSSKSGALLIRPKPPHYLYWGAGTIHITTSDNLRRWESPGKPFITSTTWGNRGVESGPPPLPLSDGNFLFFHNSWDPTNGS